MIYQRGREVERKHREGKTEEKEEVVLDRKTYTHKEENSHAG